MEKGFQCSVLRGQSLRFILAQWLSWLERRPVTAKVVGSSPIWVVYLGILAQLGEHLPYKQRVIGSSPIGPIQKNAGVTRRPDQASQL